MPRKPKILVTSAGGKTGLHTALMLRHRGFPVRALVRRRDYRSEQLERAGAEVMVANQYALTDMRAAMSSVQRAYQCAPTAPNGLHFNAVFTAAAFESRLEHVVTLSQWLSSANHPSLFTREAYLSDILIGMREDMSVTTVNPGWFADNYLMVLDMAAHLGVFTMPLGPGHVKKNAPPSNEDIASVAVAALADPQIHAGKCYRPTGPELLSPDDIASAMARALGRKVRYVDISEKMMTKALRALPPSNYSEAAVSQLGIYADEYRRGTFAVNAPTNHVEQVGERLPEDFESIVRKHLAANPQLRPSVRGTLRAAMRFAKILFTPALNLQKIQADRDYVQIDKPFFSTDSADWLSTHQSYDLTERPATAA